ARLPGDTKVFPVLPEPELPKLDQPWSVMVTGIGGTGVVTVGQLLGMAAHLEGKGAGIIDMAGLSQKNGAVVTHLKLAAKPADIASIRIAAGGADLILGCDMVTSASERILSRASRDHTYAVINSHEQMPAQFTRDADFELPSDKMGLQIEARTRPGGAEFVNATRIATALLGDSIAANLFTLGYAYQNGLIPLGAAAIDKAIALNGVAVKMNQQAFLWGRRAAHDLAAVEAVIGRSSSDQPRKQTLDEITEERVAFLTGYQDADYANQYREFVEDVRVTEADVAPDSTRLSEAVARYLFKLMAYKDEYEVARLYTGKPFADQLAKTFKGDYTLKFHLAPPLIARRDSATGKPVKQAFGPAMMSVFKILALLKGLRGTAFDIFGYTAERKRERALISEYRHTISEILNSLDTKNLSLAVDIASIPEHIRGYGHIKERHLAEAKTRESELLAAYRDGKTRAPVRLAAE
ncbi:MAG: indolepyruvate ferredoxin oxidoreductase family protein, partial [Rhizobiales bacterium]|nr:indolepyruvate ferredoxin oxidoreductase family protein [Hyphomicrobiales bacterium]